MSDIVHDYTSRDYASLVESLLDVASLRLPEWTDHSENDLGRVLLELFAYVGDTILYYQDRVAGEAFLATAVERRSVIDLLALIGYTLATPAAAAVELELTPKDAAVALHVDVGARFATEAAQGLPAVEFCFLPDDELPLDVMPTARADGSAEPVTLTAINANGMADDLGSSTGTGNQGFRVPQPGVLLSPDPLVPDGFVVEVRSGAVWERWARQTTLLSSRADDPHYVVRVDEDDAAEVVFGDGVTGRIPPLAAPVRVRYRTGGGAAGNVGPETVRVIAGGVPAQATVNNPTGASGGADRESIEHARAFGPAVYRSQHRAVTAQDYVALAESFPGVARAQAVATAWNFADVLVVAEGGLGLTDDLRAKLLRWFEPRRMMSTIVSIREPVFVSIDVDVFVSVLPTFFAADVAQRSREGILALLALDAVDFGKAFNISKVFEAVEAVDGVDFVEVRALGGRRSQPPDEPVPGADLASGRVPLLASEFPRAGTITVATDGGLR